MTADTQISIHGSELCNNRTSDHIVTKGSFPKKKNRGKSENGIKGGGVSDLIHFFKFFQKNEKTLRRGGGKPSISFLLTSY